VSKIHIFVLIIIAIIISISIVVYLQILKAGESDGWVYQGYIEGEFLYMSCPLSGQVVKIAVEKGDSVAPGALLFEIDPEPYVASYREAQSLYHAAEARYRDLTKGLRPRELAVLEASIQEVEVTLTYSKNKYERAKDLYEKKVISKDNYELTLSAFERDKARLAELRAKLETAKLGARDEQLEAAGREVERAQAVLDKAKWQVAQTKGLSPGSARVVDVLYTEGEFAPAGAPIVSLLPPEKIKTRFFVPEPMLSVIKTGQSVTVARDGVKETLTGEITYIAPYAEYTPPLIYSKENREKLVFMIEASIDDAAAQVLNPGQPVEVNISR
jgi:HlyD family secretion protein